MDPNINKPPEPYQNSQSIIPPQNTSQINSLGLIARCWKRGRKIYIIASISILILGLLVLGMGGLGGFVLIMVDGFVAYVLFLSWLISKFWQHFSKDKSHVKRIRLQLIILAIIILPGRVILPIVGGINGVISGEKECNENVWSIMLCKVLDK